MVVYVIEIECGTPSLFMALLPLCLIQIDSLIQRVNLSLSRWRILGYSQSIMWLVGVTWSAMADLCWSDIDNNLVALVWIFFGDFLNLSAMFFEACS